jgi:thiamine kinase-like enzyme
MDLPEQLVDALASALHHRHCSSLPQDIRILDLAVDDSFQSDGFGGSDIKRLNVTILGDGAETSLCLFTKSWSPSPWIVELTGLTVWFEILFFEDGVFDDINSIPGIRVPVIGSFRTENGDWIIMDDVSAELATWKDATAGRSGSFWQPSPECFAIYAELLDRIAHLHAKWEGPKCRNDLRSMRRHLDRQERKLRSFESLFREWFGSADGEYGGSPTTTAALPPRVTGQAQWASQEGFAAARKQNYEVFVARLSEKDRSVWIRHMHCRDGVVEAASTLPQTLLHGDLGWRNMGIRTSESGSEFILIDWESASLGNHAFDAIGLVTGRAFSADEMASLEEHYFEKYTYHGGRLMDRRQWKRACDVAIANNGIGRLPHFSEIVRRARLDSYTTNIEALIERTNRVLHEIAP